VKNQVGTKKNPKTGIGVKGPFERKIVFPPIKSCGANTFSGVGRQGQKRAWQFLRLGGSSGPCVSERDQFWGGDASVIGDAWGADVPCGQGNIKNPAPAKGGGGTIAPTKNPSKVRGNSNKKGGDTSGHPKRGKKVQKPGQDKGKRGGADGWIPLSGAPTGRTQLFEGKGAGRQGKNQPPSRFWGREKKKKKPSRTGLWLCRRGPGWADFAGGARGGARTRGNAAKTAPPRGPLASGRFSNQEKTNRNYQQL